MLQAHLPDVQVEGAEAAAADEAGAPAAADGSAAEPSAHADTAELHPAQAGPAQAPEHPAGEEAGPGACSERCSPGAAETSGPEEHAGANAAAGAEAGENLLPPLALPSPKQAAVSSHALGPLSLSLSPLGDISNHNSPAPSPSPGGYHKQQRQEQQGAAAAPQFATPAPQQQHQAAFPSPSPLAGYPTPLTAPPLSTQQQVNDYVQARARPCQSLTVNHIDFSLYALSELVSCAFI